MQTHQPYSEINNFLRSRRSTFISNFTGEKIADNLIQDILENAIYAPTHKLTEPWQFKVFSGTGLSKLTAEMADIYKNTTPSELFSVEKHAKFAENEKKVSHVIAICMQRDKAERIPELEEICAVACAVQNIYLSVNAYGLGGYWSTGNGAFTAQMHTFLELGEKDRCLGFFYVGVPATQQGQAKRSPLTSKVTWIK